MTQPKDFEVQRSDPQEALALLQKQAVHYARLEDLVERQRELVTRDGLEELLGLLSQRSRITEDLKQLASRLAPIREQWAVYRRQWTPPQRETAQGCVEEVQGRLRRIMERDAHDARVLSGRKHALAAALRDTQMTGQALDAYGPVAGEPGRLDCLNEEPS